MKKRILIVLSLLILISIPFINAETFAVDTTINKAVDKQECTYWINKNSKKRHNSSCRYYKTGKGYCTDVKEGKACKICGG